MPDLSTELFAITGLCLVAGVAAGWLLRGGRSKAERRAINEGWQIQMADNRKEQSRLVQQNQDLMEQVSQLQTSSRDAERKTRELSGALKDVLGGREELRREIQGMRANVETLADDKVRLGKKLAQHRAAEAGARRALGARNGRIARLESELRNWQERMRPLIEKFRAQNENTKRLEAELEEANERLRGLEDMLGSDQTRVEPMAAEDLLDVYEASNEQLDDDACDDQLDEADLEVYGGLRDNLRRIKGIGPTIEKTLNELGIFRFAQIAALTQYDIVRIGNRLKGSHSRIERENWVGQARELAEAAEAPEHPVDLPAP
jgi:predicted flap endonuclease-1-like 5' DNA nuclease